MLLPKRMDSVFITREANPLETKGRQIVVDVVALSDDGWFVGVTVYAATVEGTRTRVNLLGQVVFQFPESYCEVRITAIPGIGWAYSLRAARERWGELYEFLEVLNKRIQG